jgi:hypothetical protein
VTGSGDMGHASVTRAQLAAKAGSKATDWQKLYVFDLGRLKYGKRIELTGDALYGLISTHPLRPGRANVES